MKAGIRDLMAALVVLATFAAGQALAASFRLEAFVEVDRAVPQSLVAHAKEFSRIYMQSYRLMPPQAGQSGPQVLRARARLLDEWDAFFAGPRRQNGLKVIGIVDNPMMPGSPASRLVELESMLKDPAVGTRIANDLVAMAKQDGLDGLLITFRGNDTSLAGPFAYWMRSLKQLAARAGLEADVYLAVQSAEDPNTFYAGIQSFKWLGAQADHSLFSPGGYKLTEGGAIELPNLTAFNAHLAYARENLPVSRTAMVLEGGGTNWKNGQAGDLSWAAWQKLVAENGRPMRMPDGRLNLTLADGEATFNDATTIAANIKALEKNGFGGLVLNQLGLEDPGFWRYWEMRPK